MASPIPQQSSQILPQNRRSVRYMGLVGERGRDSLVAQDGRVILDNADALDDGRFVCIATEVPNTEIIKTAIADAGELVQHGKLLFS